MLLLFLLGQIGRWGGGKVILWSGSIKRRSEKIEKRSATKIKIWFWDILDRQANFGRGSRALGQKNIWRAAPKK